MTPRAISSTTASDKPLSRLQRWFRRVTFIITLFVFLGGLIWFLWQPASSLECVTNRNTYCDPEVMQAFVPLENTPWIKLGSTFADQKVLVLERFDEVVDVTLHQRPLRQAEIEVVYAEPLFTASVQDQHWQIMSNAYLKPTDKAPLPRIEFPDENTIKQLTTEELSQFGYLAQQLESFSPRCKKVMVASNEEITAEFENSGQVLLKIGDHQIIDTQLATLQAFFRSSTMDQDYKVLDLRFDGLAVVKE